MLLSCNSLGNQNLKIKNAPASRLEKTGRVAVIDAPFGERFCHQTQCADRHTVSKMAAGQNNRSRSENDMSSNRDRLAGSAPDLSRDTRSGHPFASVIIGSRVNADALGAAGELAEGQVGGGAQMGPAPYVVTALKPKLSASGEYLRLAVNSRTIPDLNVREADDGAILGNKDIITDMREAEIAQFSRGIEPRIEWIAVHPRILPRKSSEVQPVNLDYEYGSVN